MHEYSHKVLREEHNLRLQRINSKVSAASLHQTTSLHQAKLCNSTNHSVRNSSSPQLRDKTLNFATHLFAPIHWLQMEYTSQTTLICLFFSFFSFGHTTSIVYRWRHVDPWYFIGNKYCSLTKQKEILRNKWRETTCALETIFYSFSSCKRWHRFAHLPYFNKLVYLDIFNVI